MSLDPLNQVLFFGIPIAGYFVGRALFRKALGIRYIDPSESSPRRGAESSGVEHCFHPGSKKTLLEKEGSGSLAQEQAISLDNVQLTRYVPEGDGFVTLEGVDKISGLPVKMRGKVRKDGRIIPVEDGFSPVKDCVLNNLGEKEGKGEGNLYLGSDSRKGILPSALTGDLSAKKSGRKVGWLESGTTVEKAAQVEARHRIKAQVIGGAVVSKRKSVGGMPSFARRWIRRSEWKIGVGNMKGAKIKMAFFKRR